MTKDLLAWDQTLFKDENLFELDYLPEHFAHRESQVQSLLFGIKPAMRGARPLNCLCIGQPGTGKTTAVLKVFEEVEKAASKVAPAYVNCQVNSTRYMVFSQIFKKIFGIMPPSSGVSFKKIFSEIARHLAEKERVLVVALDDMNYLFYENEVNDVLYSLLRAHEIHPGARVGVIGIISETGVPHRFDPKVESVFLPEQIDFPPYTKDQIQDILGNRIKLGLYPNVIDEGVLNRIVEYTAQLGDLRVGIDLLKRSGLNAEARASRKITLEDVENSYEKSRLVHLTYILKSLKKDEILLLELIADHNDVNSGDLYERFHKLTSLGYTRFYETLNKLDAVKLIRADFTGRGMRGRSRVVSLRYPAEEIKKRLG